MKPLLQLLKGETEITYVWEGGPIDIQILNRDIKGNNQQFELHLESNWQSIELWKQRYHKGSPWLFKIPAEVSMWSLRVGICRIYNNNNTNRRWAKCEWPYQSWRRKRSCAKILLPAPALQMEIWLLKDPLYGPALHGKAWLRSEQRWNVSGSRWLLHSKPFRFVCDLSKPAHPILYPVAFIHIRKVQTSPFQSRSWYCKPCLPCHPW